jgi:hypothetical protein
MNETALVAVVSVVAVLLILVYMRSSGAQASTTQISSQISRGLLLEQQQDWLAARMALESALKELESVPNPDLSQQVTCAVHLGHIYERLGEPQLAAEQFKQVLASWQRQLKAGKLQFTDVDYVVTNLDFGRGTLDVCEFYVDNIVTQREKSLPRNHPDIEMSYKIGGRLLRKSGYVQEADILEKRGETRA